MENEPLLSRRTTGDRLLLSAGGAWTAVHAHKLEPVVESIEREAAGVSAVALDMQSVVALDTFGAWLIERLMRSLQAQGREAHLHGVPVHCRELLDEVHGANRTSTRVLAKEIGLLSALERIGRSVVALGREFTPPLAMLGALATTFGRTLVRPSAFRVTSAVHHLDRVGWQAVPIILLITFLIGCIIAQQGIFHFRKFGADVYVVDMVGILVLREIGVLIVAIMVAGRSGSSYTAELGAMKMREEVDALRTMGLDPVEVLILPRVIALLVALPLLTFLGSMAALYGGGLIAWLYGGMSPDIFIARLKEAISLTHFQVGMIKAPFMALVIGIVACTEGLRVKGSAESLGLQTTTSVVKSIFLVIVLDGVFAMFFAAIDM